MCFRVWQSREGRPKDTNGLPRQEGRRNERDDGHQNLLRGAAGGTREFQDLSKLYLVVHGKVSRQGRQVFLRSLRTAASAL